MGCLMRPPPSLRLPAVLSHSDVGGRSGMGRAVAGFFEPGHDCPPFGTVSRCFGYSLIFSHSRAKRDHESNGISNSNMRNPASPVRTAKPMIEQEAREGTEGQDSNLSLFTQFSSVQNGRQGASRTGESGQLRIFTDCLTYSHIFPHICGFRGFSRGRPDPGFRAHRTRLQQSFGSTRWISALRSHLCPNSSSGFWFLRCSRPARV